MPLEFGNDFCLPCEPIARIWHKGNDPIRRRTIAVVGAADVDLPEITISLVHRIIYLYDSHSTDSVSGIQERVVASHKVVSARKNTCSAHVEVLKVRGSG